MTIFGECPALHVSIYLQWSPIGLLQLGYGFVFAVLPKLQPPHRSKFFDGPRLTPCVITCMSFDILLCCTHTFVTEVSFKTEAQASMQSHRQRIPKSHSCLSFLLLAGLQTGKRDCSVKRLSAAVKDSKGRQSRLSSAIHEVNSKRRTHGELGGGGEAVDSEGVSQVLQAQHTIS